MAFVERRAVVKSGVADSCGGEERVSAWWFEEWRGEFGRHFHFCWRGIVL